MTTPHGEHERTLAFAEIALAQIRALGQPASPRYFELWYHYATAYKPALNQSINERLAKNGALGEADIDEIYNTHIAAGRAGERIDAVNARVVDEINQVLDMVSAAAGSATGYSDSLADAGQQLERAEDVDALRAIVECLVEGAKEVEKNNRNLEQRLSASKQQIEQLQENLDAVRIEVFTDHLTSLSNRKFFDSEFAEAIGDAKRKNAPLALLIADVDHFKNFNNKYGHLTGDQVLRLVALAVKQNVKGRDIAARYGGEEFIVALPDTSLQSAITVADHIRRSVMSKELIKRSSGERLGQLTISIGVAVLQPSDTPQLLIERADQCLYAAKRNGRNRVTCEDELEADRTGIPAAPIRAA